METKQILTRDNIPTDELVRSVEKISNGKKVIYNEVYYLDFEVDEETFIINRERKVRFYTKEQVNRNLKALKKAFAVVSHKVCK